MKLCILAAALALGLGLASIVCAEPGAKPDTPIISKGPDQICELLYKEYFTKPTKTPSKDMRAAAELIAARGRTTGFWKTVLVGMRGAANESLQEMSVGILGLMLEADAWGRASRAASSGISQYPASVCLPDEVVPELIDRAKTENGSLLDTYVIALTRSRDSRTKDFLRQTLDCDDTAISNMSVRFHAAVGLAQLGEKAGVEWLIAHMEDIWIVNNARPLDVPVMSYRGNLGACSLLAMQSLAGRRDLKTKSDYEKWWKEAKATWTPKLHVKLIDN